MDIHDVSLYCVVYPVAKTKGIIGVWQNTGIGMLTRPAHELLKYVDMGLRKWCVLVTFAISQLQHIAQKHTGSCGSVSVTYFTKHHWTSRR